MATKISSIYTLITADEKPLKQGLVRARKAATTGAKKIQNVLNKIDFKTAGLSAVAAAVSVGALVKKFTDLAIEQEAVEKRVAAVLRSTGEAAGYSIEQLKIMASKMQNVTTTGDEVILSGQAILATFKQIGGKQFERATMAALDLSEVMQQDLRSSIVMIGKALNDPVANMGALGRAGIQFTKSQKELIKGLWATGDRIKAQKLILNELESQFGGAAIAARDTFGGALKALQNDIGDVGEVIGFAMMPALKDMIDDINKWAKANEKVLSQDIPKYARATGTAIKYLGGELVATARMAKAFWHTVSPGDAIENMKGASKAINDAIDEMRGKTSDGSTMDELEQGWKNILTTIDKVGEAYNKLTSKKLDEPFFGSDIDYKKDAELKSRAVMQAKEIAEAKLRVYIEASNREIEIEKRTIREINESKARAVIQETELAEKKLRDYIEESNREIAVEKDKHEQMTDSLTNYGDTVEEKIGTIEDAWNQSTYTMQSAFEEFITTGKLSFSSFTASMLNDMARLMSNKLFSSIAGMIFGSGGTATHWSSAAAQAAGGGAVHYGMQGGGYLGEGVKGVGMTSGKSYEFHPNEFVVPSGKMGGGNVQVFVNNNSSEQAQVTESRGPDNSRKIMVMIGQDVMDRGPLHQAISQSFYVTPRGRSI